MTRRATSIRIPEPCAESWAAMAPDSRGRHCATCQKTVVDFTYKTDAEILAYFRQVGAGRTCGRFLAGQLGRPLRPAPFVGRPPHWQLWLAGLLAAALSIQSCRPTTGEVQPATVRHLVPPPLAMPAIDSATIGATQVLTGDTVVVSAAPGAASEPSKALLGEPAIQQ
jgi:hypothetical protein